MHSTLAVLLAATLVVAAAGCAASTGSAAPGAAGRAALPEAPAKAETDGAAIKNIGSDTLVNLVLAWAEA